MASSTGNQRSENLARVRSDQQKSWERGERASIEQLVEEHPELTKEPGELLNLISGEVLLRMEAGESPQLEEYRSRFPSLRESLEEIWPSFHVQGGAPEDIARTPRDPRARPILPLSLPDFELLERLGEGGMGVVYKARQTDLNRIVALKLMLAGPLAGANLLARFRIEEQAVARLDHPGVVRIFSTAEHLGWVYFCMEFIPGGSLQTRLAKGPIAVRDAAEVVRQLALAVQHAHDHEVIHRDLKPANVLLKSANSADGIASPMGVPGLHGTVKISDFGLARILDGDQNLTLTGTPLGTPPYMAPEQASGKLMEVGVRTDVYALGAILYECLTARPPFLGKSSAETLELVRKGRALAPHQLRPEVPRELGAICLKCLEKDPKRRYQTAEELADDLQAWLENRPTRARETRRVRVANAIRSYSVVCLAVMLYFAMLGVSSPMQSNRPGWQTKTQMKEGEVVRLIGAANMPNRVKLWHGKEQDRIYQAKDGTCAADGRSLALFELLPDTFGFANYKIEAEIRHLRGGKEGKVGLFFAGSEQANGQILSFLQVTFNDRYSLVDEYQRIMDHNKNLPEKLRVMMPKPNGNHVSLDLRHVGDLGKGRIGYRNNIAVPEVFQPAGSGATPGDWRPLSIEVRPGEIRTRWDNRVILRNTTESINALAIEAMDRLAQQKHALAGIDMKPNWQGSLGLYLYDSSASIRNVRFTPLSPHAP